MDYLAKFEKVFHFLRSSPLQYGQGKGKSMVRHIDSELQELKDLALQMGGFVEKAIDSACLTITSREEKHFKNLQGFESKINALQIQIDEACVNLLAKQAPVARDLRLVIAITKLNTDLERMGDQSFNIALSARDLYASWPKTTLPAEIQQMMTDVRNMVRTVLDAFARRDVEVSHKVLEMDDRVDELKDQMVLKMKEQMKTNPDQVEIGLGFIMIAKNLERMADHATNIAEEVIYLATGNDVRHGHSVTANS